MSEQFLYFLQQMFNGVTLGSTYALIAIGYTMVYGIIGMINFAHGEVYMIGSYVSFMIIAALMMMGIDTGWLLVAADSSAQSSLPAPTAGVSNGWLTARCVTLSA